MANHKSAIKRHSQSVQRHLRNQSVESRVKTLIKKVKVAIDSKNPEAIAEKIREVNGLLDKAVVKGVIKRNTASRKLSRLARAAHQAVIPEAPAEAAPATSPQAE